MAGLAAAVGLGLLFAPTLAPNQARADMHQGGTLERIKQSGLLRCGVIRSGVGVSEIDETGRWVGFFPDFCRALAAAVVGDPEAVDWVEVNYVVRFEALTSDAFDVLMANTTWTATRDTELGLAFTHPIYYDGQGFLAHRDLGVTRLDEVGEASVCVSRNTTTIRTLEELVRTRHPGLVIKAYDSSEGVYSSFFSRECDLLSQDRVALVSQRLNRAADPSDYVLLDDVVSKEPLGPATRTDDEDWFDIVQWTVFALILAEEHGLSSGALDSFATSENPEVRRLLGLDEGVGALFKLDDGWARRAIEAVGNYGEIYARNLGAGSALKVDRGLNALWTEGGLIYAPPLR
ncbi:MAG: amino acid ABC transporter substrate-binding protein [Marivibrio sp.]|uniref:amino acid ABC transporter substrate-binding protein n=1 Tax=Marivibrio sp. TaxID=2039719 RepID=UPI0032EFDACC